MQFKYTSSSTKETEQIGANLADMLEKQKVKRAFIALFGEMGVGKTAFTRGFCSRLGIDSVKSPTYTVLNEYRGKASVHHFDFYRISDEDDLYSIGYDDIAESDGYCIGEWSENIVDMLPDGYITVRISRVDFSAESESERQIEIDAPQLC